jgi:PTH1 family peptidyl-tRNA hydrolase
MKLIAGLGNKGKEYENTRHNIGFEFIDYLAAKYKFQVSAKNSLAQFTQRAIAGQETVIIKPLTYMNLSGDAVKAFVDKYKIKKEDIIVIHDDIDLPVYKIKIKMGGGSGGHNGLKSITERLGSPDYARIRIGTGKPEHKSQTVDYVLGEIGKEERENYSKKFEVADKFLLDWLENGYVKAAGKFKDTD